MPVDNGYHPPHIVPSMPVSSVIHAVEQAYSFRVESHKQLEGFLDMNVYVKASNAFNEDAQTTAEHGYVVKVLELGRSQKIGLVGGQLCMMEHLRRCGIPTSLPVVQADGSKMCFLRQLEDGSNQIRPIADAPEDGHLLCCLEFVPGMIIKSVPFTARLMFASGEFLAEISEALTSFKHDSFNGVTDISYMERTGTDLLALTWAVTSNEDRAIVEDVLRTVQKEVLDKSDGLRRGFVHGDFNERNVLVKPSSSGVEGDYEVCGLIDFAGC